MKLTLTIFALIMSSCTTTKYVVKEIDTSIEVKGQVGDQKLGLNDDGQAILQEEVHASQELSVQRGANAMLQDELDMEYYELKDCREKMADPAIGGSGKVKDLPEIDNLKEPSEMREEFGSNADGDLKIVKRELFEQRLKKERKYMKTLRMMIKITTKHNELCQRELGYARSRHGLPKSDIKPGHFTSDGTWVQTGE